MAPGASRCPEAKYKKSVEAIPRSVTAAPSGRAPSAKAAESSTPDGRMSRTTSTRSAPVKRAMAAPMARHSVGVELLGDGATDVVGLEDAAGRPWHVSLTAAVAAGPSRRRVDAGALPGRVDDRAQFGVGP